ncbi:MAG TPA: sterol desaturase family protein [Saprospiraceae bacterium]|nr:sterol desaturase family protein [Saprospiraceae bacterium]HMQ84123.1 sterol desaturase family protein [Saprospiraceae bacterium]
MNFSPVLLAIPLFLILVMLEIVYEIFSGKKTYRLNDTVTNLNLGSLDQVSGVFMKLIKIGIYTLVFEHFAIGHIPETWTSFIALFVLYDLCYYWSHRMAHEISLFWGGHVVHHQSEEFNLGVALRQSSTAFLWSMPFYLPLALMGFSPVQLVFVGGWNLIYQFWIHTEHIDKFPRWVEFIMNTPSHHRVHHGRDPKYLDKNYAGVFIVWDRLFGTFQEEEERPHYGITKSLQSWNPIYANFAHYIDLFQLTSKARNWRDGLGILFRPPGWKPDYMGGFVAPDPVAPNYKKYDANPGIKAIKYYILVQFVGTLALTAYFLFNYTDFTAWQQGLYAIWIIVTTFLFSLYFETQSKWLLLIEVLRLAALPLGVFLVFNGTTFYVALFVSFALLSILAFIYAQFSGTVHLANDNNGY